MSIEALMLIAMSGVIVTEAILIFSVMRLTRQMKKMNDGLGDTIKIVESKLHLIVDKINFDIPKIMEQARLMFSLFKSSGNEVKK